MNLVVCQNKKRFQLFLQDFLKERNLESCLSINFRLMGIPETLGKSESSNWIETIFPLLFISHLFIIFGKKMCKMPSNGKRCGNIATWSLFLSGFWCVRGAGKNTTIAEHRTMERLKETEQSIKEKSRELVPLSSTYLLSHPERRVCLHT